MDVDKTIIAENKNNDVSFRYILFEKETFYQTEKVLERGYWCPSFSLTKQAAEV